MPQKRLEERSRNAQCYGHRCILRCRPTMGSFMGTTHVTREQGLCSHGCACSCPESGVQNIRDTITTLIDNTAVSSGNLNRKYYYFYLQNLQIDENDASQNYKRYVIKIESHTNVLKNWWAFVIELTQYMKTVLAESLVLWLQISKVCLWTST